MLAFKLQISVSLRLAAVALTAATLTAAATGCSSTRQAVGQDNGSLNSSTFVTASSSQVTTLQAPDRHPHVTDPQVPLAVNQHLYAPPAR